MNTRILALPLAALLVAAGFALAPADPPVLERKTSAEGFKFTGMARCNTKDCHGADEPKGSPALNEYSFWKKQDPHSKAFTTLYKKPSKEMAKKMGIKTAYKDDKCLSCHTKVVAKEDLVPDVKWSVQSGVSCEVCHGPAEKWIDPHDKPGEKNWSHEKSVANGMKDLRDLVVWAKDCAGCHLQIDHEMIAAGHPRLHFELVDYNARTGAHWKTPKHPSMAPGFDAKAWTTGQVISLAEALRNLATRIKAGAPADRVKLARDLAGAYAGLLKHVKGFDAVEIPGDAAAIEALAGTVEAKAASLAPADASLLATLAGQAPPAGFAAARQAALAFNALSDKAGAKADIDAMCALIASKNEPTFDAAAFAAAYAKAATHFK